MGRNWTQQFQIRIALHFFWILTGSRSFSRKLDLIWNWLGNFGKKSVQFQFIWYVYFLRISSPKSEQVLLFDILKAFESSFFCIDTVFVGWHWQVTIYLTWYNQGLTIHYSFMKQIWNFLRKKSELDRIWNWTDFDSRLGEWNWTSSHFGEKDRNGSRSQKIGPVTMYGVIGWMKGKEA